MVNDLIMADSFQRQGSFCGCCEEYNEQCRRDIHKWPFNQLYYALKLSDPCVLAALLFLVLIPFIYFDPLRSRILLQVIPERSWKRWGSEWYLAGPGFRGFVIVHDLVCCKTNRCSDSNTMLVFAYFFYRWSKTWFTHLFATGSTGLAKVNQHEAFIHSHSRIRAIYNGQVAILPFHEAS
jgi:hypothetical protein